MDKLGEESRKIRDEVRGKVTAYIVGGLGVVVGLAWNEAIRSLIEYLFPFGNESVTAKFIYAFVLTVVLVLLTVYLTRLLSKDAEK